MFSISPHYRSDVHETWWQWSTRCKIWVFTTENTAQYSWRTRRHPIGTQDQHIQSPLQKQIKVSTKDSSKSSTCPVTEFFVFFLYKTLQYSNNNISPALKLTPTVMVRGAGCNYLIWVTLASCIKIFMALFIYYLYILLKATRFAIF